MRKFAVTGLPVALCLLFIGLESSSGRGAQPEADLQSITFNHAVHVQDEEMECADCHQAETSVHADFPSTNECYKCHRKPQGENPEEPKVRAFRKAHKRIPFKAANHNVGHVYFSHRAHVVFAGMTCEECHGDVGSRTQPVVTARGSLHSMDACMNCHREKGATLDCLACHK